LNLVGGSDQASLTQGIGIQYPCKPRAVLPTCSQTIRSAQQLCDHKPSLALGNIVRRRKTGAALRRDGRHEYPIIHLFCMPIHIAIVFIAPQPRRLQLAVLVQSVQHLAMTLQTDEHSLGTRHTSRTSQTVGQRDLRRRRVVASDFLFSGDFVFVGGLLGLLFRQGFDGFDASDAGRNEVVQVVGGEDRGHDLRRAG